MTREQQAFETLKARFTGPAIIEPATVKTVDTEQLTCQVELLDETIIEDVRLKAAVDNITDGLVQLPSIGSSVLIARIGNDVSVRFVIAFSNVTKVMFNGGENGPLVIWNNKLKTELDKVKQILTNVVNVLNGASIPEPGNSAPSALQAALKTALTGLQTPSFENLTDPKVEH